MHIRGSVLMRPGEVKQTSTYARKIKIGKKLLFGQQLQLTTKQISTKKWHYCLSWS